MLKINLATKPGLQDETKDKSIPAIPNELFESLPPSPEPVISVPDQSGKAALKSELTALATPKEDMFASVESNLEMLEQAEAEEFVPRHVSLPPEKRAETEQEERIEALTKIPRKRRLRKILGVGLGLIVVAVVGYWAYVNFLKAPVQPDEYEKPQPVTEEMVPSAPATTPSEIPPVETVEPVYQTPAAPLTYQSVGQPALSQVEEVYASQIMAGARYSLSAAQVLGLFPSGTRVQYLKLKSGKISFLIYVAEEAEGQRIKTGIGNLPGIQASEVFYIERMPTVAAPNVQIMAILKLRLDSGTPRSIRFQNDVNLSQVLWSIGKRNNLNLQPLGIAEPPAAKPRLAEIRGDGGVNSIANFLQELANIDLNLGIEQVSLTPASDATGYSGFFNFTINSVIYPQKM